MHIEDGLNILDEMLDSSWSLPLSGGRCVIDVEHARDIIDQIRMNLPVEIQQAEALLAQQKEMIAEANLQAEEIIRKAEERSRVLLAQDEAVKAAQQKASQILNQAQTQSREMRLATQKFADNILVESEKSLTQSLEKVQTTRKALRKTGSKTE